MRWVNLGLEIATIVLGTGLAVAVIALVVGAAATATERVGGTITTANTDDWAAAYTDAVLNGLGATISLGIISGLLAIGSLATWIILHMNLTKMKNTILADGSLRTSGVTNYFQYEWSKMNTPMIWFYIRYIPIGVLSIISFVFWIIAQVRFNGFFSEVQKAIDTLSSSNSSNENKQETAKVVEQEQN